MIEYNRLSRYGISDTIQCVKL